MSTALNAPKVKLVPWWLVLIEGILLIIIGIFLLTNPLSTFVTIIWVLGIYWLISGVFNIIKIFFDSSMWGWKIFAGIVGIIAGWFLIQYPFGGSVAVAATTVILLGLFGIFIGIVNLIQAFRGGGWGTGILGVVSIILGILLLANRFAFTFSLPWTIGILAILGGIIAIFNAFRLRSAKKDLEEAAEAAQAKAASMADAASVRSAAIGAATMGAAAATAAKADDMVDAAADVIDDAQDTVADAVDDVQDAGAGAAAAAAAVASKSVDAMQDTAEDAGDAVDEAVRSVSLDLEDVDDDMAAAISQQFPDLNADQSTKVAALVAAVRSLTPADARKLNLEGITGPNQLLEQAASRKGRVDLAGATGIDASEILKWANDLDLKRIKGVGVKYADLLEASGVDTVVELAQRNPTNLYNKMAEVNEEQEIVESLPGEEEVAEWVAQAKELPRLITY